MRTPSTAVAALPSSAFADHEPVLQSHPLIGGVEVPRFGDTAAWPLLATPRPANAFPSGWTVQFAGLDTVWNLRARELAMALLNPEHPALTGAGVDLRTEPAQISTVRGAASQLKVIARWAQRNELSSDLSLWRSGDARRFIADHGATISQGSARQYVTLLKLLHQLGPILTGGGLPADPWPGQTSRKAVGETTAEVQTPNIKPEVWFALVRAAWTYVHEFAPDILAGTARYQQLVRDAAGTAPEATQRLEAYLADPTNPIPLHTHLSRGNSPTTAVGDINWRFLTTMIGIPRAGQRLFAETYGARLHRRRVVEAAVADGRGVPGGLLTHYAQVNRPDGTTGPWHPGLCQRSVQTEAVALRAAAYILVAAFSMMRDSEVRAIQRGSVVDYYGAPAIASTLRKHEPDRPRERWWIIEPVAQAISVAEALSWHPEQIFVAAQANAKTGGGFSTGLVIRRFIEHVNSGTAHHGLHIPPGRVAAHMFRKTMAMLCATEPGGEIALGIQLKHAAVRALANRTTQGYSTVDASWSKLLDTALDGARIERLSDFYADHHTGNTIGFGPGADRLKAAFDNIKDTAQKLITNGQARQGDARVEYDLLRKARIPLRFGTLNHCTMDDNNPAGAKCLEGAATIPTGHRGPLQDRCQPGRCANSIVGPEHLPIWTAEKHSLLRILDGTKLPPPRQAALRKQLNDVQAVLDRANPAAGGSS